MLQRTASRAYPKLVTGEKMLQRSIQSVSEVSCETHTDNMLQRSINLVSEHAIVRLRT